MTRRRETEDGRDRRGSRERHSESQLQAKDGLQEMKERERQKGGGEEDGEIERSLSFISAHFKNQVSVQQRFHWKRLPDDFH